MAKNAEIKKYQNFLKIYSKSLYNLEDILNRFPSNQFNFDFDPINLEALPYEQASLLQLIKTDNKVLNKIVTVFAALCCEMDFLVKEGEVKYCWGLLLYGEGKLSRLHTFPIFRSLFNDLSWFEGPEAAKESGENLTQMGRFVSFLQELSCFTKRCYEVIKSTLYQLSILYSSQK